MTEAKTIRRFWWLDEWQIEEVESWLSEMAAQGWIIKDSGRFLATFVQGDVEKIRKRTFTPSLLNRAGWSFK